MQYSFRKGEGQGEKQRGKFGRATYKSNLHLRARVQVSKGAQMPPCLGDICIISDSWAGDKVNNVVFNCIPHRLLLG